MEILAPHFDLAKTLDSGQVFHWQRIGNGFIGTIEDRAVYAEQRRNVLFTAEAAPELDRSDQSSLKRIIGRYFALDHPLEQICESLPRDPLMNAAKDYCRGLRIIRQPKWECLATFICSSMKQVQHIRQISFALRKRFGEEKKIGGHVVYTFPAPERLAKSTEKELRACALGYRAPNLLATARLIAKGKVDLEQLATLPDNSLNDCLCTLPGVGAKIANCVMLFAYERLGAFPIDVWIDRVLRENYFPRAQKLNASRLRTFTDGYFGDHGGYAQQYIFHYARTGQVDRAPATARRSRNRGTTPRSSLHDKRRSVT